MNFIGVDLHKQFSTVCVMNENLTVVKRKTLYSSQPELIVEFFKQHAPFKVVIEATASYVWFAELLEPLAEKIVLANPKKLRVIAEVDQERPTIVSTRQVLAGVPGAWRHDSRGAHMPTPRQRPASDFGPPTPVHPESGYRRKDQDSAGS